MGSQCCKCSNGKNQQVTRSRPPSINIRLHGNREISTFHYKLRTYENIDLYRSQTSGQYSSYHPRITDVLKNNYSPADNAKQVRQRFKQMNNNGSLTEPQQNDPPLFVRKLSDLAVKIGTRTRFLVEIRSTSYPKVTWHRNDEPVQLGSRFAFFHEGNFYCIDVAPVTIEDEGYWTCIAENDNGRSTCGCCLNVLIPKAYKKPYFLEELRALLTETGSVSLECKVLGVPTPVLKWFKDGNEMKAGDIYALTASSEDSTSLGIYRCEAINCMGVACSSSKVHVIGTEDDEKSNVSIKSSGPLPIFKKLLKNESCKIGDRLVLSCQVQVPPWPKDVAWYNEKGRVQSNEKYHIIEDGLGVYSIEIQGLEAMDKGEWKCVVTSFENIKQLSTSTISMFIPKNYRVPRFMEDLRAILTEEGLVSFECKVVGFPTPILKWFKDGEELKPGDVYQLTGTNSLGSYCCIARNCMGEAKSTAELTIEDIDKQLNEEERLQLLTEFTQAPKFKVGLKCCEAKIDENFTFTVQVDVTLSPEPSIFWYRDNELITEDFKHKLIKNTLGNFHLEIKNLELIDQAQWKCLAENDFGHTVTSCFLKLIIPKHFRKPKYLENLKAILSDDGTVSLECKVIGVPQPALTWYKDGIELKPGDIHRIISGGNGTCCLGTYTCRATNCMGSVSSSASLVGFTDDTKQAQSQENQQLDTSAKNVSLSTIQEERTSQLYDTPQTEYSVTLDDHGEISFSLDGKEISVSLYETPDLTEEDAIQIVEMYADQLSEHISEGDVIELPPMRFTKETSTTGNLLMEAVVIDVSPDYFMPGEKLEDLRTEADVDDVSIMDDQSQSNITSYSSAMDGQPLLRPLRKRQKSEESSSSKSDHSEKSHRKSMKTLDLSEDYHSAKEPSSIDGQFSLAHENISSCAADHKTSLAPLSERNSLRSNETNDNFNDAANLQLFTLDNTDINVINPRTSSNLPGSEVSYISMDLERITIAMSILEKTVEKVLLMKEENYDSKMFTIAGKLGVIHECLDLLISNFASGEWSGTIGHSRDEFVITTLMEPLEDLAQTATIFYLSQPNTNLFTDFEQVTKNFKLKLDTLDVALERCVSESSIDGMTENCRQLTQHLNDIMNDICELLLTVPGNNESRTEIYDQLVGESPVTIEQLPLIFSRIHFELSSILERASVSISVEVSERITSSKVIDSIEHLRQCIGDIAITLGTPLVHTTYFSENDYNYDVLNEFEKLRIPLTNLQENLQTRDYQPNEIYILKDLMSPVKNVKKVIVNVARTNKLELDIVQLLETIERHISLVAITSSNETLIDESEGTNMIFPSHQTDPRDKGELMMPTKNMKLQAYEDTEVVSNLAPAEKLQLWTFTTGESLDRLVNAALVLERSTDEEIHALLCKPLNTLLEQAALLQSLINHPATPAFENNIQIISAGFLGPLDQLENTIEMIIDISRNKPSASVVKQNLEEFSHSISDLRDQYQLLQDEQKNNTCLIKTITDVVKRFQNINDAITIILNTTTLEEAAKENLSMTIDADDKKQQGRDIQILTDVMEKPTQPIENYFNIQVTAKLEQFSTECLLNSSVFDNTTLTNQEIPSDTMERINDEETHIDGKLFETKGIKTEVEELCEPLPSNVMENKVEPSQIMENLINENITQEPLRMHAALANSKIFDNPPMSYEIQYDFGEVQSSSDVQILKNSQVSLESSIEHIIEDELDRQGRIDCASNDFIKFVLEKVDVAISEKCNINDKSILEEIVRDITVEELQLININKHESNTNVNIPCSLVPEQKFNDTSIKPLPTIDNILDVNKHEPQEAAPHASSEIIKEKQSTESRTIVQESTTMGNSNQNSCKDLTDPITVSNNVQPEGQLQSELSDDFRAPLESKITYIIEDELNHQGAQDCLSMDSLKLIQDKVYTIMSASSNSIPESILVEKIRDITVEELQNIQRNENESTNDHSDIQFPFVLEQKINDDSIKPLPTTHNILAANEQELEKTSHASSEIIEEKRQSLESRTIVEESITMVNSNENSGKDLTDQISVSHNVQPEGQLQSDLSEDFRVPLESKIAYIIEDELDRQAARDYMSMDFVKLIQDKVHAIISESFNVIPEAILVEKIRDITVEELQNIKTNKTESTNDHIDIQSPLVPEQKINEDSVKPLRTTHNILDLNEQKLQEMASYETVEEHTTVENSDKKSIKDLADKTSLSHKAQPQKQLQSQLFDDFHVPIESNIASIIEDEFDHQGARDSISMDFLKLIQGKVHAIISESANLIPESILVEKIRDITVEELQNIKTNETENTNDQIDIQFPLVLEQKLNDDSIKPSPITHNILDADRQDLQETAPNKSSQIIEGKRQPIESRTVIEESMTGEKSDKTDVKDLADQTLFSHKVPPEERHEQSELSDDFHAPLESNIAHIIEDELNRQGALHYASIDFLQVVQERVHAVMKSESSNLFPESIFMEKIRDITVEELQIIKMNQNESTSEDMDNLFPLVFGQKLNDDSVKLMPTIYTILNSNQPKLHETACSESSKIVEGEEKQSTETRSIVGESATMEISDKKSDKNLAEKTSLSHKGRQQPQSEISDDFRLLLESNIAYVIEDELDRQGARNRASIDFLKLVQEKVHVIMSESASLISESILEEKIRDIIVEELHPIESDDNRIIGEDNISEQFTALPEHNSDNLIKSLQTLEALAYLNEKGGLEKLAEEKHEKELCESIPSPLDLQTFHDKSQAIEILEEKYEMEKPITKTFIHVHDPAPEFQIPRNQINNNLSNDELEERLTRPDIAQGNDAKATKCFKGSQILSESDILHIVEDELDRQGMSKCASIDFIKLIETKVHAILSATSNLDQHALLEEMIRDITVEELQSIKSNINEGMDDNCNSPSMFIPEQKMDDSIPKSEGIHNVISIMENEVQKMNYENSFETVREEKLADKLYELFPSKSAIRINEKSEGVENFEEMKEPEQSNSKEAFAIPKTSEVFLPLSELNVDATTSDIIQQEPILPYITINNELQKGEALIRFDTLNKSIECIIEDELDRQGALTYASLNLIDLVKDKVRAITSESPNFEQHSLLEELIRDVTVEHLQYIKSEDYVTENKTISKPSTSLLERKSADDLPQHLILTELSTENQSNVIDDNSSHTYAEIMKDSQSNGINKTAMNTSKNNIDDDASFIVPDKEEKFSSIPNVMTLNEQIKELISIELRSAIVNCIEMKQLPEVIEANVKNSGPLLSTEQTSPEIIKWLIQSELQRQQMSIFGTDNFPEETSEYNVETLDMILKQKIAQLVTATFEAILGESTSREFLIETIKCNIKEIMNNNEMFSNQRLTDRNIEELITMELELRKSQILKYHYSPAPEHIVPMETITDDSSNESVMHELVMSDVNVGFGKLIQDDRNIEQIESKPHVTIFNNSIVSQCHFEDHSLEELNVMESGIQSANVTRSCDIYELQNIRPTVSISDIGLGEAIEPLAISDFKSVSAKTVEIEQYINPLKSINQSMILQNPVTSSQCVFEECTQDLEIIKLQEHEPKVVTTDPSVRLDEKFEGNILDLKTKPMILEQPRTADMKIQWEIPKEAIKSDTSDHYIATLYDNDALEAASEHQHIILNCPQLFDEIIARQHTQNIINDYPSDSKATMAHEDSLIKASEHEVNVQILHSAVVHKNTNDLNDLNIPAKNYANDPQKLIFDKHEKASEEPLPICKEQSSEGDILEPNANTSDLKSTLSADKKHALKLAKATDEFYVSAKNADDAQTAIKSATNMGIIDTTSTHELDEQSTKEIILREFNKEKINSLLTKTDIEDFVADTYRYIHERFEECHPKDVEEYARNLASEKLQRLRDASKYEKIKAINLHADQIEKYSINSITVHDSEIRLPDESSEKSHFDLQKCDTKPVTDIAPNFDKTTRNPNELKETLNSQQEGESHKIPQGTYETNDPSSIQPTITSIESTDNDELMKEEIVIPSDSSTKADNQLEPKKGMLTAKTKNVVSKNQIEDLIETRKEVSNDICQSTHEQQLATNDKRDLKGTNNQDKATEQENELSRKKDTPKNLYSEETHAKKQKSRANEDELLKSERTHEKKILQVRGDYQQLNTERNSLGEGVKLEKIDYTKRKDTDNVLRRLRTNDELLECRSVIPLSGSTDKFKSKVNQRCISDGEPCANDENSLSKDSELSESLGLNVKQLKLKERDASSLLPSISIDTDNFTTTDLSLYSDRSVKKLNRYQQSDVDREYLPGPRHKGKKPVFCMKLIDRTAAAASRIKLTCTVLGDPDPFIFWMQNGAELLQTSNRYCITNDNGVVSFEIYSVKPQDSGNYACIAKNIHGEASTEAKLKVYAGYESTQSLPIFTRPMKDTFKLDEDKLVLECRVRAQPPPIITWLKDGTIIHMSGRYKQSDLAEGICRLEISNPCDYDSGMYACRAENKSGFSECNCHFTYRDNSGTPNSDGTITRAHKKRCNLTSEMHSITDYDLYSCIQADTLDSEHSSYTHRTDKMFSNIEGGNIKFDGGYVYLRENGKPATFISRPVDKLINACVGEDVSLSFRVGGIPKPKVSLMKGLVDITNGARSYKESHDDYVRITFKRIEDQDEGTYCILVKNRYGYDRSFFTIRVKQRARSLTPARSIEWNFENMRTYLSPSHDPTLSDHKFIPGPISSEPVVVDGGRTWLTLSWGKAEQRGPAPIVAYRVDAWLLGGDGGARWIELGVTSTTSFDAFNLCPGEEYKFRITPRNRYGWGKSVTMISSVTVKEFIQFPEFLKILPSQLKALQGTTLNLDCEINISKSTTHVRWYKDSTELDVTNDPRFIIHNSDSKYSLSIVDIRESDSGRYVCDATNFAGRVSTFARVQVVSDPKIADADLSLRTIRSTDNMSEERPPDFTMRLRDRRVQATYPVRLTCQVDGNPEPVISWYKDEEKINFEVENMNISKDEAHFHTLEISRSKIDNTGIYMVKAQNSHGCLSCRCHLVVDEGIRAYIAPEFSHLLNEVYTVIQNEELRMNAQIEAYPAVGITWYRDGKRIRPNRNTVMSLHHDGTIELTLAHISYKDAGLYCCVATNEVGRAESKAKVYVLTNADDVANSFQPSMEIGQSSNIPYSKEPVFITKPLSTEAFEGDNIIILCQVIGDPKPDVIWLRDFLRPDYYKDAPHFRPVGLGPQYQLEIPYAKLDFTGTYSVIAKNCFGEAKAVISLQIFARDPEMQVINRKQTVKHSEIQTLPVIKSPLRNIRCCDGDAVTFICRINATPPPSIRWEKGGKLVPLQDDISFDFEDETAQLHIQHVYSEDEGEYVCVAYNNLGSAYTSACLIVDVPEGKEISLNRRLKKPMSLLSLSATPISTPRSTPTRSLSPACVMRDLTQKTGRRSRMPVAPKFYAIPHNRVAEEGETIRFQCAVSGHPRPWANWDKDGTNITSTSRISITEKDDMRILEIEQIIYEDAGLYRITLENEIGKVEATARLEVIRGKHGSISRGISHSSTRQTRSSSHRLQDYSTLTPNYQTHSLSSLPHSREKFDSKESETIHTSIISQTPADVTAVKGGAIVLSAIDSQFPKTSLQGSREGRDIVNTVCLEDVADEDSTEIAINVEESSSVVNPGNISSVNGLALFDGEFKTNDFLKSQTEIIIERMDNFSIKAEDVDEEDSEELGETSESYIIKVMPRSIFDDQFDTLEIIGKGRYGVVRKVIEKSTEIHRAAKFVRTIKVKDRQQVLKEIDIMNTLNHPKLLRLINAFEGPKEMIMVMEYITGGELFERVVADDFTLTEKDSVLFVRQICEGITYMHDKHIVHMDLKPENIMCQSHTCHQIKLIDFGLAQILTPNTPVRVLFGTPEFVSPEIISFEPIGPESDMWSIGVICYVLLTGLSPFMGDSDAETFVNITRADYDFDDEAFNAISKEAIDFISSLLIKKKELRMSARNCLAHPWLAQCAENMSQIVLSTDKLKNFIIRRKWQKTGNAIRALGRMTILSAKSRKPIFTDVPGENENFHTSSDDSPNENHELNASLSDHPLTFTSHYIKNRQRQEILSDEESLILKGTYLEENLNVDSCRGREDYSKEIWTKETKHVLFDESVELTSDKDDNPSNRSGSISVLNLHSQGINIMMDDEKYSPSIWDNCLNNKEAIFETLEKPTTKQSDIPLLSGNSCSVCDDTPLVNKASTESPCETNNLQLGDEEDGKDEISRITRASTASLRHVRTGNVSRTAKLFETEGVSLTIQQPSSRLNIPDIGARPQNERIRKAFEFWNK